MQVMKANSQLSIKRTRSVGDVYEILKNDSFAVLVHKPETKLCCGTKDGNYGKCTALGSSSWRSHG